MLRLIKERKLQQEEGLAGDTPLVSHIALPSKKATSVLFLGSCEGSLSSAQCHPFQSLARNNDDQTHDGDPQTLKATVTMGSSEASSSSVGAPRNGQPKTEIQALAHVTTESAVPRHHGFTRTISFVSGDIVNGTTAKRPRNATMWRQPSPTPSHSHSGLRLSTAKDSGALSPLHIFVRHQIEVFEASETDLKQPAPGRRIPIQLNQVGLRCIHCKHLKARERKKRAVCYPSSVGRVYHSVSDMKFAHFPCQQMPKALQDRFSELKDESQLQSKPPKDAGSQRVGGTNASTARYYHDSALETGMVDGKGGIFASKGLSCGNVPALTASEHNILSTRSAAKAEPALALAAISQSKTLNGMLFGNFVPNVVYANANAVGSQDPGSTTEAAEEPLPMAKSVPSLAIVPSAHRDATTAASAATLQQQKGTKFVLSSEFDNQYLTPIHCFVRRQVEVFTANASDLATPAPGRKKPIVLGQVGFRCVHCSTFPVKDRVKRAVCFPPSVSGCYHAVSNMKFDHFKYCRGLPKEAREEFLSLFSGGKRSSSSSTFRPRVSNSTAQYYHDSALRMGLYDTPEGIRFRHRASPCDRSNVRLAEVKGEYVPKGMEALIVAATDPIVRAVHEKRQSSPKRD